VFIYFPYYITDKEIGLKRGKGGDPDFYF